ncbi:S-layer homology domain-containing protein [Candidatus Saccharibacteria bacterium]|nr:S-layer homology domain-containing protein [Candidatus Saccharibacteria bacterium]
MKKLNVRIVSLALSLVMLFSLLAPAFASWQGVAINEDGTTTISTHIITPSKNWQGGWFTDCDSVAINTAAELGVVKGNGDGTFRPFATLTHAEWAQMLFNLFAEEEVEPREAWYTQAMAWLGDDADPNESAPLEWVYVTLYALWCEGEGTEFDFTQAIAWATERDFGPYGSWRRFSIGNYISRIEAVELVVGLCELS